MEDPLMNKKTGLTILLFASLLAFAGAAQAQTDAENCKDHPLFSRMKNFYISECKSAFDAVEFYVKDADPKSVEGQMTRIEYYLSENAPRPSQLQVRRNYGNAGKAIGATILYDEDNYLTGRLTKNGKETWFKLEIYNDGNNFALTVLEVGEMVQEVAADAMYEALSKDGFMALYINFDTGKAEIKPESQGTVAQIATLLNGHADLKLSIEGHTDNVGTPAANKTLSEQRAQAVMAAVLKGGVAASRVSAVGWGQEKPIADNRSEEGRAKNRRVEIVKK
jgi:outer membrane protein OmpA-like peptidoglycan-associated protein